MAFEKELPKWENQGVEPPESKKATGWEAGEKPPADYFNWQWNRTYEALKELQEKAAEKVDVQQAQQTADDAATAAANAQSDIDTHKEDKNNPHEVTSEQVNQIGLNSFSYADSGNLYPMGVSIFATSESGSGDWPTNGQQGQVITFRSANNRVTQFITDNSLGGRRLFVRKFREAYGWFGEVELLHTGNTTNIVNQEYETGEWTPVLEGLDVPGNHTYSLQRGNYHIIGDRVFLNGEIRISTGFDSNISGGIVISGLPFVQRDSANDSAAFAIGLRSGIDPAKPVYGFMTRGENVLSLLSGWTSSRVRITHEDLSLPIHISFSGHYRF